MNRSFRGGEGKGGFSKTSSRLRNGRSGLGFTVVHCEVGSNAYAEDMLGVIVRKVRGSVAACCHYYQFGDTEIVRERWPEFDGDLCNHGEVISVVGGPLIMVVDTITSDSCCLLLRGKR